MKKLWIAAGALLLGLGVLSIPKLGAVTANYNGTIQLVDSLGNVMNGVASAVTASYNGTYRIVNSAGQVLDFLTNGGRTFNPVTTATGADTITFTASNNCQELDLINSTNETIALADARTPAAHSFVTDVLKVCQPSGGNDTVAFSNTELASNGSGWAQLTQPQYTVTASRCDIYCWNWNTTFHNDCGFNQNVPQ